LRARLIAGVPADLVGSLTGLTEGRFPVYARARYADDLREQQLLKKVGRGQNAAHLIEGSDKRHSIGIYTRLGAPVVAVNDGVIKETGESKELGRYVRLQDVYGNRFTYAHLGSVSSFYPVPKSDPDSRDAHATPAHGKVADPKRLIVEEAASWNADCIFLGARGHSRLERFLLGSVAAAVAARATCTVEVVRP